MTLNGIDVSRWQASTPSLTGLSFLFARATYGAVHDGMYAEHIANAREAGLMVGAYAFGVGDVAVPDQVSAFLAAAGSVDFYVLDLERNGSRPSMTNAQATAFIAAVKAKGHKVGLYHSESGYPSLGQSYNWVANWSQVPSIHWAFWQWQGSPLDRDRFNGDMAALEALAGQPTAPAKWSVSIQPAKGWKGYPTFRYFGLYNAAGVKVASKRTRGFSATCSAPARHGSRRLVQITSGFLKGQYVLSIYATETP